MKIEAGSIFHGMKERKRRRVGGEKKRKKGRGISARIWTEKRVHVIEKEANCFSVVILCATEKCFVSMVRPHSKEEGDTSHLKREIAHLLSLSLALSLWEKRMNWKDRKCGSSLTEQLVVRWWGLGERLDKMIFLSPEVIPERLAIVKWKITF